MLFTFISQLPLIPVRKPTDLVTYNQVVFMLGLAIYITIGYLIYSGKMPSSVMAYLPHWKWLVGLLVLDLALYCVIHRFQFGLFPVITSSQLPPSPPMLEGGGPHKVSHHKKSKKKKRRTDDEESSEEESSVNEDSSDLDLTAEEVDELSSILKNHSNQQHGGGYVYGPTRGPTNENTTRGAGLHLQTVMKSPMVPPGMMSTMAEAEPPLDRNYHQHIPEPAEPDPVEVSVADGDYFQKDSGTVVENWDADEEFSNIEYVEKKSKRQRSRR